MRRVALTVTAAVAAAGFLSSPAIARDLHARGRPHATPAEPPPASSRFYPEQIEGGVTGNLPFNNQIRKHTDPLNANGGR